MQIAIADSYDAIGTQASPATMTAAFSGNTSNPFLARYLKNLHLDFGYTPGTINSFLEIIVEGSNDDLGATPTYWYPMGARSAATTEIDAFGDSGTDMGTVSGLPIIFPGDKTDTAGVKLTGFQDFNIVANWVRIKVQEKLSTGSTYGTANIRITLAS
jgi:hypothetical protein